MDTVKSALIIQKEANQKKIIREYFQLIGSGKFREGLSFFRNDCKTHNPFISGSIENLTNAMVAASKDQLNTQDDVSEFTVKHILADGDIIAAHTELLNSKSEPNKGGLRQVHLFRFEGDKIVEYWDITQQILPDMPNASGAF